MENTQIGKGRVRIVRGSSIAHIRQLRDERLARRLAPAASATATAAPPPELPMTLSRETSRLMADHGIIARPEAAMTPPAMTPPAAPPAAEAVTVSEAVAPAAEPVAPAAVESLAHLVETPAPAAEALAEAAPAPVAEDPAAQAVALAQGAAGQEPVAAAVPAPQLAAEPAEPVAEAASAAPADAPAVAVAEPAADAVPEPAAETAQVSAAPPVQAAEAPAGEPAKPAATSKPETESDLLALPGAGVGLVWLLGLCGISSLADLARADTVRLEANLGLVGTLLDLEEWVRIAQQTTAARSPEGSTAA